MGQQEQQTNEGRHRNKTMEQGGTGCCVLCLVLDPAHCWHSVIFLFSLRTKMEENIIQRFQD